LDEIFFIKKKFVEMPLNVLGLSSRDRRLHLLKMEMNGVVLMGLKISE
jgi:hypothetical protein